MGIGARGRLLPEGNEAGRFPPVFSHMKPSPIPRRSCAGRHSNSRLDETCRRHIPVLYGGRRYEMRLGHRGPAGMPLATCINIISSAPWFPPSPAKTIPGAVGNSVGAGKGRGLDLGWDSRKLWLPRPINRGGRGADARKRSFPPKTEKRREKRSAKAQAHTGGIFQITRGGSHDFWRGWGWGWGRSSRFRPLRETRHRIYAITSRRSQRYTRVALSRIFRRLIVEIVIEINSS